MEALQYPVGKFQAPATFEVGNIDLWIQDIADLPAILNGKLENVLEQQLDTPYREGGWKVRQVVHHIADSHMNCFVRFKLALTENSPVVKTYDEAAWAEMPDSNGDIKASLQIIEGIHTRWTILLKSMKQDDFYKTITHPELGEVTLFQLLALYSWHSKHHTAHIQNGLTIHN